MKIFLTGVLGIMLIQGASLAADRAEPKNETDRINYSVGYQIGKDFQQQRWEFNIEMLAQGIRDAIDRRKPLMSPGEMNVTLQAMKKNLIADQRRAAKEADETFLLENAKKEGVIVLPSSVQYKIIKAGTGRLPTLEDDVTVKYSVNRVSDQGVPTGYHERKPTVYPLKKALPGLREVLQLMEEGSVWQVVLPPGPAMGGHRDGLENAGVLIYELTLVSVRTPGDKAAGNSDPSQILK